MVKKIVFTLVLACCMFACTSLQNNFSTGSNIKKVELGMTKQSVVAIMGDGYKVLNASQTPEGNFEMIRYLDSSGADGGWFALTFLDGQLVEWQREVPINNLEIGYNVNRLRLGMMKQDVVAVMGNVYKVVSASQTQKGNVEVIRYIDPANNDSYSLVFLEGRLKEWSKEVPVTVPVTTTRPRR